jgi:hypothetical protein
VALVVDDEAGLGDTIAGAGVGVMTAIVNALEVCVCVCASMAVRTPPNLSRQHPCTPAPRLLPAGKAHVQGQRHELLCVRPARHPRMGVHALTYTSHEPPPSPTPPLWCSAC